MAYDPKNLSVLAYANGFTLWHYATADSASVVDNVGYFNAAAEMVRAGDMILANVDTDSSNGAGIFLVRANSSGVVDVADLSAIGTQNTD